MERKVRIVIVEDEENIREELKIYLRNAGYDVAAVTDFTDPVGEIFSAKPDLVLLDMNLPGIDGLHICDKIRQTSQVPVIFVTGNNTSMDELNCILRGGDDYISKPYQMPILMARIAAVLKRSLREQEEAPVKMEHAGVVLDVAAATVSKNGSTEELTRNELKILFCLYEHAGEIVSRAELIDYLWENEVFIDDNTLSVNVTRIRAKLESIGASEFIETRRGMGYRI